MHRIQIVNRYENGFCSIADLLHRIRAGVTENGTSYRLVGPDHLHSGAAVVCPLHADLSSIRGLACNGYTHPFGEKHRLVVLPYRAPLDRHRHAAVVDAVALMVAGWTAPDLIPVRRTFETAEVWNGRFLDVDALVPASRIAS